MRIRGPLSDFTKRVEKSSPPDILAAIAHSLNEDYGIKAYLFQFGEDGPGDLFVAIPISDFTALCIELDETLLQLYKLPFEMPKPRSYEKGTIEPSQVYWDRKYELADPKSLDDILRIVQKNYHGHNRWPHKRVSC